MSDKINVSGGFVVGQRMYKPYTRQISPKKNTELCPIVHFAFQFDFVFVIENIFRKNPNRYQCHELIVLENGKLKNRLVLWMRMRLSICLTLC